MANGVTVFNALGNAVNAKGFLAPIDSRSGNGWLNMIKEGFSGAWQRNIEWSTDCVLSYHAVFACITLIASDIGKLRPRMVELDADGVWTEIITPISKILRKPNHYQNYIQFKESWIISKLIRGNSYILKRRDDKGNVDALYVLDPCRVTALVSESGDVFYQLSQDNLTSLKEVSITVPASEIIHDRMNCLFHPLCGVSPLFAAGFVANIGLKIESESTSFFENGARPAGILTAVGAISDETATRLKAHWDSEYTGRNSGKVAVLGDGLKFEGMRMTSTDAQLLELLKWTEPVICSAFHVPPFKAGYGTIPAGSKVEDLNQIYYSDCLQSLIESMELCLDEAFSLPLQAQKKPQGIDLDLSGLLRMDMKTQIDTLSLAVKGSIFTPNEARRDMNRKPIPGGDTIYMQQQNYSLEDLANRSPPASTLEPKATPATAPTDAPPAPANGTKEFADEFIKNLQDSLLEK